MSYDQYLQDIPSKINDYIMIGNYNAATNPGLLMRLGINDVVSLVGDYLSSKKKPGVTYHIFYMDDEPHEPLEPIMTMVHKILCDAKKRERMVLVHCMAGISRSVSMVIGHLIREGMCFDHAYKTVKSHRAIANPNIGFLSQLKSMK